MTFLQLTYRRPARAVLPSLMLLSGFLLCSDLAATELALSPCRIFDTSGVQSADAECGIFPIAENPERPDGKTIDLYVARIPARAPTPAEDPLVVIQGGPGGSSVELYVSMQDAFDGIRKSRDILLVDQRGTGRSNPLRCDAAEELMSDDAPIEFDPVLAAQFSRECLADLPGNPRFYTTSVAVKDLEAVRVALSYPVLNIYGVSYGTRVALHYMRRYPEQTRSVIIDGVAPAQWSLGPDIARFGQNTLDDIFARCEASSTCSERFGDLEVKLSVLASRLRENPRDVTINDPLTGHSTPMTFTQQHLVMAIRMMSYQRESQALLPLLIHEAYNGNIQPMAAQAHMVGESLSSALAMGMHNSVVCTEDMPFIEGFNDQELRDTYMGPVQMASLRAFCRDWPRGVMDDDFKQPLTSDLPVLVLSGEFDPVTPPRNGALAAESLSNQLTVVAPGQGHGVAMRGCMPRMLATFVDAADPEAVDAECVNRMGPLAFFEDFSGPTP
ncbi:MAG: alpha/beta fold hydrolase [Lysobacterales bacterium]